MLSGLLFGLGLTACYQSVSFIGPCQVGLVQSASSIGFFTQPGSISLGFAPGTAIAIAIDSLLQDSRWLENHHATWGNRHLGTSLRVPADPLPLLPHHEGSE